MKRQILTFCLAVLTVFLAKAQGDELIIQGTAGNNIYGIVSRPTTQGQHGVVIMSHGFNGTHHWGREYFDTLNSLGYIVYTFDFPCGSIHSRSDRNTMNMSIKDEIATLTSIVEFFQKQPDVDCKRMVLMGESQGGLVSAMAAANLQDKISKLILFYPALCIPDNWNRLYAKTESIPDTTKIWNVCIGRRFFMELQDMDVYGTINNFKGPVLIVHGSADPVVPLSYSEEAIKKYNNAELKVIDKAGHGFKHEELRITQDFVRQFVNN